MSLDLAWLPEVSSWKEALDAGRQQTPRQAFSAFQRLANSRMDFVRAGQLDKVVQRFIAERGAPDNLPVVRLAVLSSATVSHLVPGIRLGALRRGFLLEVYVGPYGMYRQELADVSSGLHRFQPDVLCFAFDAQHLIPLEASGIDPTLANLRHCWHKAQEDFRCTVIQQTVLPRFPALAGNHEDRLATSPANLVQQLNQRLREEARTAGVHLLSVDTCSAKTGISAWFERALWYSAKQEIHPRASLLYGDQLGRLIAAIRGKSSKCLVLDLDNTLWGGVIGDDGMTGIALGQGSPAGEAFVDFQRYARQLAGRGVILAVCSKNDHANAMEAFQSHPEMILRCKDISCFVANWQDKASNLRHIAETLNIGLDSLVFADDNPAERALIRAELPMVAVPELPEDPADYVTCLSEAGYFEAVEITDEDRQRTTLYQANATRQAMRESATDLTGYLRALDMKLICSQFDELGSKRIVQLINKTNQFNLTTRRTTDAEIAALLDDESALTLQMRLTDAHGDNGVIGIVVGRRTERRLAIDTWLMSCRVLGRGVEDATLNVVAARAREMGCTTLTGLYRPSDKNVMVRDHYARLGFEPTETRDDGSTLWQLSLNVFVDRAAPIEIQKGETCRPLMSMAS